ncbi:hypothetical protein BVRB_8g188230 [Beta vulgaris subsp. vulgaris]|uniref:GDSL esterase/lipase At1g29670 n=1 Tax=Beta vulgaris subsp. vulgaris TaxID=3555 RepID=UPI00053F6647|nr:GDSL esterase/lipase At1g29670 [Beta vulgaris subsp. vulgaris]KMT03851.1 hypothetical protein BVRB_8g188230 [Beta vulgaris subsp. vulgaris]
MWRIISYFVPILITITKLGVHANTLVPCFFIFGDSLSDPGNNNPLKTKAKANYPPYGIDFPGKRATGRFSNGRTSVDIIAEKLGFNGYIPPFNTVKDREILKGVNYASGAAGIQPETGRHLGQIISFDMQLQNHRKIMSKVNVMVNGSAQAYLKKCLYTVNIGSNDYINNYYMPEHYNSSSKHNPDSYANTLIDQYRDKVKTLYQNGARKVAIFGLGPIGCTLGQVKRNHPWGFCVDSINIAVYLFNIKLRTLVAELNRVFHDAKFTFINIQNMVVGPLEGVFVLNSPCCQLRGDFMCKESSSYCNNRNRYYFWDGYHPTEAVQKIFGARAFHASTPLEANPMDIESLIKYNNSGKKNTWFG